MKCNCARLACTARTWRNCHNIFHYRNLHPQRVGEDGLSQSERDIYSKSSNACRIPIISQHIDPMICSLLFPRDECGWYPNLTCFKKNSKQNKLTTLQYYSYKLSIRENFNSYLCAEKLTQQYIIDAWTKIENCKINVYQSLPFEGQRIIYDTPNFFQFLIHTATVFSSFALE